MSCVPSPPHSPHTRVSSGSCTHSNAKQIVKMNGWTWPSRLIIFREMIFGGPKRNVPCTRVKEFKQELMSWWVLLLVFSCTIGNGSHAARKTKLIRRRNGDDFRECQSDVSCCVIISFVRISLPFTSQTRQQLYPHHILSIIRMPF